MARQNFDCGLAIIGGECLMTHDWVLAMRHNLPVRAVADLTSTFVPRAGQQSADRAKMVRRHFE